MHVADKALHYTVYHHKLAVYKTSMFGSLIAGLCTSIVSLGLVWQLSRLALYGNCIAKCAHDRQT